MLYHFEKKIHHFLLLIYYWPLLVTWIVMYTNFKAEIQPFKTEARFPQVHTSQIRSINTFRILIRRLKMHEPI